MESSKQYKSKIILNQLDELHQSLKTSNYQVALLHSNNLLNKFPMALHLKCNLAYIQFHMGQYHDSANHLNFVVTSGFADLRVLKFYLITLNLTGRMNQIRELLKIHFDGERELNDITQPLLEKPKNEIFVSGAWEFIKPFNFMKLTEQGSVKVSELTKKLSSAERPLVYGKLVDYFPFDNEFFYDQGVKEFKAQNFKIALVLFKSVLLTDPNSTKATLFLASTYNELKEHGSAIQMLRELSTRIQSAEIFNNLGNSYLRNNQQSDAFKQYNKAIQLSGNKPIFVRNFIRACKQSNNTEKATKYLERLKSKTELHPELYYDLGVLYEQKGKFSEAINLYRQDLEHNRFFSQAVSNLFALKLQLRDTELVSLDFLREIEATQFLKKSPVCRVLNSIELFLDQEFELCCNQLDLFKKTNKKLFLDLKETDQKFCVAYFNLLKKLIEGRKIRNDKSYNVIYHFAESHCLSFANQTILLKSVPHKIIPKMCIGGKAFHFSQHNSNRFKEIVVRNLRSLSTGSTALFGFGEIDCRIDEGILSAFLKNGSTLDTIIKTTCINYVNWIKQTCTFYKITPLIATVPAPTYMDNFSLENNNQRSYVIMQFNRHILTHSKNLNIKAIDIYSPTLDDNGFSNNRFHIDQYHISDSILNYLD